MQGRASAIANFLADRRALIDPDKIRGGDTFSH